MDNEGTILIAMIILYTTVIIIFGVMIGRNTGVHLKSRCDTAGYILQQEVVATAQNNKCILIGDNNREYLITVKDN